MKLKKISFKNFRCFKDEAIEFSPYTSLIGANNCGKSTVLRALNIFFDSKGKSPAVTDADFYVGCKIGDELSIKFEFDEVTGDAEKALDHYVRSNKVVFEIVAAKTANGIIEGKCRGVRYGLKEFAPLFAAQTATDRKPIYEELRKKFSGLPKWKNMQEAMEAIRAEEAKHADDHIAIASEENAYGATGPIPILRKFIEWIYVPAVKDVSSEASEQKNSAFSKIVLLAIRQKFDFTEKFDSLRASTVDALKKCLRKANQLLERLARI